jgi:hypothetical protein
VENLLSRKDILRIFGWNRSTLWRREREGLPIIAGRIGENKLAWWLEQRDAAKRLGIPVRTFLHHPREIRETLLAAALQVQQAEQARAT